MLHLFLDAALKTVAYLRVSTRSQDLANQKLAILEFSQKRLSRPRHDSVKLLPLPLISSTDDANSRGNPVKSFLGYRADWCKNVR